MEKKVSNRHLVRELMDKFKSNTVKNHWDPSGLESNPVEEATVKDIAEFSEMKGVCTQIQEA